MAKTATAEQLARQRTREWRTRLAAEQAEQDRRISAALAGVLNAQQNVTAAGEALAQAQTVHARAVEQANTDTATALTTLRDEGLSAEQIAELSGLSATEVRRTWKTGTASTGGSTPAAAGSPEPASVASSAA